MDNLISFLGYNYNNSCSICIVFFQNGRDEAKWLLYLAYISL